MFRIHIAEKPEGLPLLYKLLSNDIPSGFYFCNFCYF